MRAIYMTTTFASNDPMPKSILILENDQDIRGIIETKLSEAGYDVLCPVDSYTAIEHAQSHDLDLIILNDQMPIISGKDTLTILTEHNISVPAIVFLEKFQEEENYAIYPNCICLRKPFKIDALLNHVSHLLNK
jgi:DNA-binding response OmpR family regulator